MKLIDEIMVQEDRNSDGYITYQEFLIAIKGGN
jgi:Ca2+-binding EF-hand superfamily protein